MDNSSVALILVVCTLLWIGSIFILWQQLKRSKNGDLKQLVDAAFAESAQRITGQHQAVLSVEQERIQKDLDRQRQQVEQLVGRIEHQLDKRHQELAKSDQQRIAAFATLQQQILDQRHTIEDLSISATKLARLLSNNQARGQWGERVIEDLLTTNGLIEGVHYKRQFPLTQELRPDITLLLPDRRSIAIDVKFPLSELAQVADAGTKQERAQHLTSFKKNVKDHLQKVSGYIVPEARTLDYAMLFVPSEMVFSFLNQETPELIEEAMRRRVLLVSPFTFLVVAGTLRESYRNFMISDSLHDAVLILEEFVAEWTKFRGSLAKYGKTLQQLSTDYDDLTGVRTRQLERKIEKVRSIQTGVAQVEPAVIDESEQLPLPAESDRA